MEEQLREDGEKKLYKRDKEVLEDLEVLWKRGRF